MSLLSPPKNSIGPASSQAPALGGMDPTYFLPKVEPNRLLSLLLRRGWIVLTLALLGAVALYSVAGKLPKSYRATGSVYVSSKAPVIMNIQAVSAEETSDLEQMRSVEQGLSASTLLMRVIEANHLAEDPTYVAQGASQQSLLAKFMRSIKVELRRGTRIIDITVTDRDPARAQRLVESLVSEYEKWTSDRQNSVTLKASEGLAREEEKLRLRMEESAKNLQVFRETHPVPGLEGAEGSSPVRDALGALSSRLTETTAARLKLESEFEAYAKFDSSSPAALAGLESSERGTEVLAQVRAIQQKETEFNRIKERYLYKHPVYQEIFSEITVMKTTLAATVRAAGEALAQRYHVAKENELKLASEVEQARGKAVDVEGIREKFRSMAHEAEGDRTLHDSVALRLRETSMAATVPASVLRWEGNPMLPEKPASPQKIIYAAVGGFAGFLAGLAILAAMQLGDRKVRDSAAAARAIGAPLLVSLPQAEPCGDGLLLLSAPSSVGAEAFRRLRAVLTPPPGSSTARTVLFASAAAGEGKSFCALNYASSLALQGHRTLLLDADLRSAGLSHRQQVEAGDEAGLGGYLAGNIDAATACFATALPNLYMISSGPLRADASELLAGTRFPALLEDAYRWFDRVVIDSPAVLSSSDALSITRYADRTCLMVRDQGNENQDLKRAADLIRSAGGTLIGFIWNEASAGFGDSPLHKPGISINRPSISSPPSAGLESAKKTTELEILPSFA